MATDSKPWIVEYAKSGRAGCKGGCRGTIAKDELRIGRIIQAKNFDGAMPVWHHANCLFEKPRQIKSLEEVEGIEKLRWEDMQKIRNYIESASKASDSHMEQPGGGGAEGPFLIEYAKSSRVTCKGCGRKIEKGEVRVSTMVQSESAKFRGKVPVWQHVKCFLETDLLDYPVDELPGWKKLSADDRSEVLNLAKPSQKPTETGKQKSAKRKARSQDEGAVEEYKDKQAALEKKNTEESHGKRLRSKESGNESANPPKVAENTTPLVPKKKGRPRKVVEKIEESVKKPDSEFERMLEEQNKAIWAIKDNLQKKVTTAEMKKMLVANDQESTGSENDLRERCADGMLFGVLEKCPMCSSFMDYQGGPYKCRGFLTAYTKCNYSTFAPKRLKDEWKIPDDMDNEYLLQWKKEAKVKGERLYLPSSTKDEGQPGANSNSTKQDGKPLSVGLLSGGTTVILGRLSQSQAKWRELIEGAGGRLASIISPDTKYVVVNECDLERHREKLQQARSLRIPVLKEAFLIDCVNQKSDISVEQYTVEIAAASSVMKVKVKGRSAVHEDSGLQERGHILEQGNTIYNITLNLSDLNSNKNSYYILQIIEEDGDKATHLFRKWGRVGSKRSKKSEKFSKATAISEFKRLFAEKTGNEWDSWQKKDNFKKHPGKYYPLEIDHGMDDEPLDEQPPLGSRSKLDSQVVELMKLLFDMETYRAAMLEYEINVDEMPLGKLSKRYIQQGFEVLTEIQNIMAADTLTAERKDSALKDASNRFFTLIPAIDPHVISTDEELRSKIEMLEALRDMEIASTLINARVDASEEDPLDTHYRMLHCDIAPLPHNSSEYLLVKRYLDRTHASSHKNWALELEDVFVVNREGEDERFEPFKKISNRMLLWHGSRTTNFVGILSQGLRIAPPEAPASGYMFGKGIYFADLVSKSAQYCYTSTSNSTGLLLLCEVALGKSHELRAAQYMEKPPRGNHSTKGLGRTKPDEKEFETFRGDVTVPCGRPIGSGVRGTELLYNEYIVYDPSQVKARFLLKVRFKHK